MAFRRARSRRKARASNFAMPKAQRRKFFDLDSVDKISFDSDFGFPTRTFAYRGILRRLEIYTSVGDDDFNDPFVFVRNGSDPCGTHHRSLRQVWHVGTLFHIGLRHSFGGRSRHHLFEFVQECHSIVRLKWRGQLRTSVDQDGLVLTFVLIRRLFPL